MVTLEYSFVDVNEANASAVVYTMVEMAKAHCLNIYRYFKFVLEYQPGKDMTDEQLAEPTCWSEKLQSIKTACESLQLVKGCGIFIFGRINICIYDIYTFMLLAQYSI